MSLQLDAELEADVSRSSGENRTDIEVWKLVLMDPHVIASETYKHVMDAWIITPFDAYVLDLRNVLRHVKETTYDRLVAVHERPSVILNSIKEETVVI
jgi:hypothetical protein